MVRRSSAGIAVLVVMVGLASADEVTAQRAQDNALTSASDAFGTVVGNQAFGLYSADNARGFSPTQAQNLRIEGLYFDQQTSGTQPYLFSGSRLRVGISAQAYAFPSPSGVADLILRKPGDKATASALLVCGPLSNSSAEIDTQYPLVPQSLQLGVNVAAAHDFDYNYARTSDQHAVAMISSYRPDSAVELIPFLGYTHNSERRERPIVFADRSHPVVTFSEQHLPTQSWTRWDWSQLTGGVIGTAMLYGGWDLRAGLFRSAETARSDLDLLLGLTPDGSADHVVDASPRHTSRSYSGDIRLTKSWSADARHRELTLTARGRRVERSFGGDSISEFGRVSIYDDFGVRRPAQVFGDQLRDSVRQISFGINYSERWKDRMSVSVGVMKTAYSRAIGAPNTNSATEHTGTTLPTVAVAADVLSNVTSYASYTRGLEDSSPAPSAATNRGELPPATPTWQIDGGVRVRVQPRLQFVAGVFEIHKAYFNLDTSGRYRQVGVISSRGIESSIVLNGGEGLTIVAGGVWLHPEVERQIPELGGSGSVPVGPVPRTLNLNVDFAPLYLKGWGASLQWVSLSSRVQSADDLYRLEPFSTLTLGVRRNFKVASHPSSVRVDVGNVTNASGLTITSDYLVFAQVRRTYQLTFALDL